MYKVRLETFAPAAALADIASALKNQRFAALRTEDTLFINIFYSFRLRSFFRRLFLRFCAVFFSQFSLNFIIHIQKRIAYGHRTAGAFACILFSRAADRIRRA